MSLPFKEIPLGDNQYIREFSKDTDTDELEWHLDKENRIVEVLKNDGWEFQMDNQLPIPLINKIFIPKETYHRILKGTGDLMVRLTKLI